MAAAPRGADETWEGVYVEGGWIPADYLERVAIMLIDGRCSLRHAQRVAAQECAARHVSWVPFRAAEGML
jgi:hypothetical protein